MLFANLKSILVHGGENMAKVITIANQKGGVAKTTTATALASGLKIKGYNVLLIDTDPQCNASDTYQAEIEDIATLYDLLFNKEPVQNTIQHKSMGDIIPSDPLLSKAENMLNNTGREYVLKKAASLILDQYDYIIIDTPPTLGILLINALTFANEVIVPVTADRYSLQGLSQLYETIGAAKEYTNPNLKVIGLLLAKYNGRTNLSKEVAEGMPIIAKQMNTVIFDTAIRESTAAKEAQAMRKGLYEHSPNCTTAQDYLLFTEELIKRGNIKWLKIKLHSVLRRDCLSRERNKFLILSVNSQFPPQR